MFQRHAKLGDTLAQRVEDSFKKHRLAVEDIDMRRRHLAMDAERQADLGHLFQNRHDLGDIAHA